MCVLLDPAPFQYHLLLLSPLFHSPAYASSVIVLDHNSPCILSFVVTFTAHPRLPASSLEGLPLLHSTLPQFFFALLQERKPHLQSFHSVPHSLRKTPGCHYERFPFFCSPLNPAESALTDISSVTPLESALTKNGGRGDLMTTHLASSTGNCPGRFTSIRQRGGE